jgi:hypothetical protein
MKSLFKITPQTWRRAGAALLLALSACSFQPSAFSQGTTQVVPRQYTLFSGLLTNNQNINTNAALPGQNIGVWTNTFIPFANAHSLGLSVTVTTTNNMAHASNLVFNAYRAFDTNYGSGGLNARMGTNFETVPFFSWTDAWTTNQVNNTNIPTSSWEPATSFGLTISNQCTSNVTVSVVLSVTP